MKHAPDRWLVILLAAGLALSLGSCGKTSPRVETFTRTFPTATGSVTFPIAAGGSGTVDVSLTWVVTTPGTGRFASNLPAFDLIFDTQVPKCGFDSACEAIARSNISNTPPLTLSASVSSGQYILQVGVDTECGDCVVDLTLTVMHS